MYVFLATTRTSLLHRYSLDLESKLSGSKIFINLNATLAKICIRQFFHS